MTLRKRNKINASMNMGSMTDLVFLLLIFFLVASTLIKPDTGLDVSLPNSSNQVSSNSLTAVILTKDLRYFIKHENGEKKEVSLALLEQTLRETMNTTSDSDEKPVVGLYADKTVPVNEVVEVMKIAIKNNLKMYLATQHNADGN